MKETEKKKKRKKRKQEIMAEDNLLISPSFLRHVEKKVRIF